MTNGAGLAAQVRHAPHLTVRELAHRTGHPSMLLRRVLEEMKLEGLVEEHDGGWRLTDAAEAKFGRSLRDLLPYGEEKLAA